MNRHSRFAILMAVCAAVSSCGGGGGGTGTSIATSAGTAAFGQPVTDMAGIYELYDTVGIAHGLIDDQGHVIVISQTHAGDPALNLQQFVDFSGVATSTGAGTWSMQN